MNELTSRPSAVTFRLILAFTLVSTIMVGALATASSAEAASRTFTGIGVTANGAGYGLVATSGENYDFGTEISRGNPSGFTGGIVALSATADGRGYAEVSATGQVYAYGTVVYRGNPAGFSGTITGISVTADGQGYAVVSSAGQNYDYGTVVSRGNPTGFTGSIVGVSVTADGQGYANVSSAGQNYDYGTVVSRGNPTGFTGSIVGVSVTADGQGYANVSSAGQNYDYGTVVSRGNPTGFTGSIVGVSVTADGRGYVDLSSYGQVYAYGTVRYLGNGDPGAANYAFVLPHNSVTLAKLQAKHHTYPAIDIDVPTGTPFYAVATGHIAYNSDSKKCGIGILLYGDDGVLYAYCHASSRSVSAGSRVSPGTLLGKTGATGDATGPHLHFQINYPNTLRCPQTLLQSLWNGSAPPTPQTLPTTGCFH